MKQLQSLITEEHLCRGFSFVALCLRKVHLWWLRRRLSFFKRKAGKDLSPHIKSLVTEDTHEKNMRVGPTHRADASLFAGDRILATVNISHLESFPWRSVFLIKNEGCFQPGAKHRIVQYSWMFKYKVVGLLLLLITCGRMLSCCVHTPFCCCCWLM